MTTRLIFVESNTTGTGEFALEQLLANDIEVVFLTRDPGLYPFLQRFGDGLHRVTVDTNSVDALSKAISEFGSLASSILTFSDYYVPLVCRIAREHGWPALNPQAAEACRNKHRLRQVMSRAGLPVPKFVGLSEPRDIAVVGQEAGYPCVIKPADESGSLHVSLVLTEDALKDAVSRLWLRTSNQRGQAPYRVVLAEQYLAAPEYSVETISLSATEHHVIGVTRKHLGPLPTFIEIGHDFPAAVSPNARSRLTQAALDALEAVGFDYGIAHTEVRWNNGSPTVVEINPRLAGGMIPELIRQSSGLDLINSVINLALGRLVDLNASMNRCASIQFIVPPFAGTLENISRLEMAQRLPHITQIVMYREIGQAVAPPFSNLGRVGHAIAVADNVLDSRHAVETAIRKIGLEVKPGMPH